ncbi:MAG TPA: 2,3-diphosphoglycerate-dependent phosphoglycerate mutase [Dehalococcoidia bacterium]|nr:2,3-diphosphoglycerate-dependent phosphoglycerate mutase [Dehalococcoidia bacterium]
MTVNLVLVRHGQSTWNQENRFTGWVDVDLSEQGVAEAHEAGRQLREAGLEFDVAFTSVLQRAIHTLWIALDEMGCPWLPVQRAWELNERHYGALQGLNKAETAAKHGDDQVQIWRRSYDIPPPPLARSDPGHAAHDRRYAALEVAGRTPDSESLKTTMERVLPCWRERIAPRLEAGERVLIAAHGNSLRALVKHLDGISNDQITGLNIPTGLPLAYELDADLKVQSRGYLAGEDVAAAAVAAQGRAKPEEGLA